MKIPNNSPSKQQPTTSTESDLTTSSPKCPEEPHGESLQRCRQVRTCKTCNKLVRCTNLHPSNVLNIFLGESSFEQCVNTVNNTVNRTTTAGIEETDECKCENPSISVDLDKKNVSQMSWYGSTQPIDPTSRIKIFYFTFTHFTRFHLPLNLLLQNIQNELKAFTVRICSGTSLACVKRDGIWYLLFNDQVYTINDINFFIEKGEKIELRIYKMVEQR